MPFDIQKAQATDAVLIAEIGAKTFWESHHESAPAIDIEHYIAEKYQPEKVQRELEDAANVYHILYYKKQIAGYSKIIFNCPNPNIAATNITKLERLYLLQDFYDLNLGKQLFDFNVQLAKAANQAGIWLFVWTGNHRALRFYNKTGFVQVGNRPFKISERHENPNYELFLSF